MNISDDDRKYLCENIPEAAKHLDGDDVNAVLDAI